MGRVRSLTQWRKVAMAQQGKEWDGEMGNGGGCSDVRGAVDSRFRGNDGVECGEWRSTIGLSDRKAALILAFSYYKEVARGTPLGARASRPQSRACARRTLILAFSHKGRRDPLAAIRA